MFLYINIDLNTLDGNRPMDIIFRCYEMGDVMRRKLQKNRNSLFANIPTEIVEDMALKSGDKLDFCIVGEYIKVVPVRIPAKIDVQGATREPVKAEGCK